MVIFHIAMLQNLLANQDHSPTMYEERVRIEKEGGKLLLLSTLLASSGELTPHHLHLGPTLANHRQNRGWSRAGHSRGVAVFR